MYVYISKFSFISKLKLIIVFYDFTHDNLLKFNKIWLCYALFAAAMFKSVYIQPQIHCHRAHKFEIPR